MLFVQQEKGKLKGESEDSGWPGAVCTLAYRLVTDKTCFFHFIFQIKK